MGLLDEMQEPDGIAGPALEGLRVLTEGAEIPFSLYNRRILPLDGYVFWLKSETVLVQGSVHRTVAKMQNEDETISINRVVFTSGTAVVRFDTIGADQIWVGEAAGVKFAFSAGGPRFRQSGLYHYAGDAVYPALESQLIDDAQMLSSSTLIVSNSLPVWLALASYNPVWLQIPNPGLTLYPSYAVPDNLRPPYGVIHIEPDATEALQAFPSFCDATTTQAQLVADRVRVTLYGLTNDAASNFVNLVLQYSRDTNAIGMMSTLPVIRDQKRTQSELGILAMKKTVDWEVSYFQGAVRAVAQQLISEAVCAISPPSQLAA